MIFDEYNSQRKEHNEHIEETQVKHVGLGGVEHEIAQKKDQKHKQNNKTHDKYQHQFIEQGQMAHEIHIDIVV